MHEKNQPYEGDEVLDRVAQGGAVLEPMRKVLCSCQQVDPRTGKAKAACVCKRAKAGALR